MARGEPLERLKRASVDRVLHRAWTVFLVVAVLLLLLTPRYPGLGKLVIPSFALAMTTLATAIAAERSRLEGNDPEAWFKYLRTKIFDKEDEQLRQLRQLRLFGGQQIEVPVRLADGTVVTGDVVERMVEELRSAESRRLVIIGPAGSGKTVLAIRMELALLQSEEKKYVPIRVSASSWRPPERPDGRSQYDSVERWLIARIMEEGVPEQAARNLLKYHRILPLIDGLDEVVRQPGIGTVQALTTALDGYHPGDKPLPLIVTCLDTWASFMLAGSRVVTTELLTPGAAAGCLPVADDRWAEVRECVVGDERSAVARALVAPLFLNIAMTVYGASSSALRHPQELLDFPSEMALKQRLLDGYIGAATEATLRRGSSRPRYRPVQVTATLRFLAVYLDAAGTDIRPHELWMSSRQKVHRFVTLATGCLWALIGVSGVVAFYLQGAPAEVVFYPVLLIAGAFLLTSLRISHPEGEADKPPLKVLLSSIWNPQAGSDSLFFGTRVGRITALVISLLFGLMIGTSESGLHGPLRIVIGIPFGLFFGAAFFALLHLRSRQVGMGDLIDFESAESSAAAPGDELKHDNRLMPLALFTFDGEHGGLAALRYLGFRIVNWPVTPLRLDAFFGWACEAGLLRRSGTAYQFRHMELKQSLLPRP